MQQESLKTRKKIDKKFYACLCDKLLVIYKNNVNDKLNEN